MEKFGKFGNGISEFLERDIERDFCIRGIGKRLDFQRFRGQGTIASDFLQARESVREPGRQYVAVVDGNDGVAFRQIVSKCPRVGVANRPLRAIAVMQRLRGMCFDLAGPIDSAHARKRFAQNLEFEFHLRFVTSMLIVAAAASSEVRAYRLDARRVRFQDFQRFGPRQFFLPRSYFRAYFFSGQDVRHEHRVSLGVAQAVAAIHQLLNR